MTPYRSSIALAGGFQQGPPDYGNEVNSRQNPKSGRVPENEQNKEARQRIDVHSIASCFSGQGYVLKFLEEDKIHR